MSYKPYLLILWTIFLIIGSATTAIDPYITGIFIILIGTPIILLLCALWPKKLEPRSWKFRNVYTIPICIAIIISIFCTHWPLKLHYFIVRSEFKEIANQIRAGKEIEAPLNLGLFRIVDFEMYNKIPFLNTRSHGNRKGFVLCPPTYHSFNLGFMTSLDDDWQFISED